MKSTISDVARLAGVSIKTVSRVLNGEPNVTNKTRAKVQSAARDLNYAPSLAARGLAGSKSYLLALLYDIPSPGYIAALQRGATTACRGAGYHLIVEPMRLYETRTILDIETSLRRLPVDGLILTPPVCDTPEIVALIRRLGIPYVPVTPIVNNVDVTSIQMDNKGAAREMTEHLIALGHTEIGFIKGPDAHGASAHRFDGFLQAMQFARLSVNPDFVQNGAFTVRSGLEAADRLLTQHSRPTAIFASNDDMAAGVISAAARMNIKIPEDLSVCGFDDTPLATIITPNLTTIAQPIMEMGHLAADILIQNMKKESDKKTKPRVQLLKHTLITRTSTQQPRKP